ncbi:hypothetical protein niasHT_006686 [Heterodera trifolii]|uniref:Uncharacterized protein n=1 Tax=Heterodera trifolii TaxID=157864 RepID=A0ABD2M9V9_9BILA
MPNFARRTGGPPCHQKRMAARVAIHLFYTPGGTETTAANSGHSANARREQKHRVFKLKGNVEMNDAERTANEELDDVISSSANANAINGINGDEAAATVSDGGANADNCERAARVVCGGLNGVNANANNGTNAVTEAATVNNGGANADNGEGEAATVNDGDANVDNGTNAETAATAQNNGNGLEGNADNGTNGANVNANAQHRKRVSSGQVIVESKRRAKERSAAHPRPPAATANPVPTSLNMPFPMMMMMPFPMMMPFNFPFPPPPPPPAQQQQQ